MKIKKYITTTLIKKTKLFLLAIALLTGGLSALPSNTPLTPTASAACSTTAPATTYGKVTQTVNVVTAGSYRVWSRIKAPNTTANSYYFQVGSAACYYNVGDNAAIPANTWTWVNYESGITTTPIDVQLAAGSTTLTYIGKEADVQLDKVMLLTNKSCVPTGDGANCGVNDDVSPAVSITSPTNSATVSGTVNIAANASDASGILKVEFLVNNQVQTPADTTAAYSYPWDTTKVANGTYTLQAKAYDNSASPNVGSSNTIQVTVSNGDTTPPSPPANLVSSAKTSNSVSLTWGASTDNVAVTGYRIFRGATQVGSVTSTAFTDTGLTASTAYSYTVKAVDAKGNLSNASNALSVTTSAGTDSTAPVTSITAPASGTSVKAGTAITVNATATDNIGVTKFEILVNGAVKSTIPTGTSSTYTYVWNTTGVAAGTYSIASKAYDAAGNTTTSNPVSVTITSTPNGSGDVNGDGRVNAIDLSSLISHDGQNFPAADFNNDGTVGAADMAILLSKWTW